MSPEWVPARASGNGTGKANEQETGDGRLVGGTGWSVGGNGNERVTVQRQQQRAVRGGDKS
jgi:hypothetical protein